MNRITDWGRLPDGRTVHRITVARGGLSLTVSDFGCCITALETPDRQGRPGGVVLGYDTLADYFRDDVYMGAVVGRYANRIAGAAFPLNGRRYQLTKNEGRNTLHGGSGFHKRLWNAEAWEDGVRLTYLSPDGEDGFPGNLAVSVEYSLREPGALSVGYAAESDRDTVLSLSSHSYFNLNGGGPVFGHRLRLEAPAYTPVDSENIPTGEIRPVDGTPFDFRGDRALGSFPYDHNFALSPGGGPKVVLYAPESGRRMTVYTDLPGLQLYTGRGLSPRQGRDGALYGPGMSVCLETQFYPDSPNRPDFPSPVLPAGRRFESRTIFRFDTV